MRSEEKNRARHRAYCLEHREELAAKQHQRYLEHKEELTKKRKQYELENKERLAAKKRQRRIDHKEEIAQHQRVYILAFKYGLTLEQYDRLLIDSCGICPICGKQFKNNQKEPHIDHNHKTGKVRGLLCGNCNMALGLLEDSPINCTKACVYLMVENDD